MLQHRIPEQRSSAAEQLPKETTGDHRKHSGYSSNSHIYTDQQPQQPQENGKKSTSISLFQDPTPTKKITFGMRHVACMLYITQRLSISHVPISPPCVDYRPTKSSLSFFCHAVTPCVSRVCRVLCRNVVFYSIRIRKR